MHGDVLLIRTSKPLSYPCLFLRLNVSLLRVHSLGVIWIRISDPRSVWVVSIKGTDESMTRVDFNERALNQRLYSSKSSTL